MSQTHELVEANEHTTCELAVKWAAKPDVVASWCRSGLIEGAVKQSTFPWRWVIPSDAKRPLDSCVIRELLWQILEFQNSRITELDLTRWGIPLSDIPWCVPALVKASYLLELKEGQKPQLSNKALALLGRKASDNTETTRVEPLVYASSAAGAFVGSMIKQLI